MASLAAGRDTRPAAARSACSLVSALLRSIPTAGSRVSSWTGVHSTLPWIVYGLGERDDATVFTVDTDEQLLATVATAGWPSYVEFVHDDGVNAVREFAPFDLVFADAAGGKLDGLDVTIDALTPGGVLIVDDMDLARHADDGLSEPLAAVRDQILSAPSLVGAELDFASGVIVATKRAR